MNGAAVVLLTVLAGIGCMAKVSKGFRLDVATSPEWCGDGINIQVKAVGNHMASINGHGKLSIPDSVSQVREMLRTRAESVVFVGGEHGSLYGDFIELVDAVYPEARITSIVTPQVEMLARRHLCLEVSCRPLCANFPDHLR